MFLVKYNYICLQNIHHLKLLTYLITYPLLMAVSLLPYPLLYALSDFLSFLLYKVFKFRLKVVSV